MTEETKRSIVQRLGEFLREASVLIAVFAPLDLIVEDKPLTWPFAIGTLLTVGATLAVGIYLGVDADD